MSLETHPRLRLRGACLIAIVVAAYMGFVTAKLAVHGFDISRLIVAGDAVVVKDRLRYPIAVEPHSAGYDGQYFYRLALDPTTTKAVDYGIPLQYPAVRAQRIVYPVATWVASLGYGPAVPYALVAVNLFSIAIMAWLALRLAAQFGIPRRWGLLIPFYPGFVMSMARDTAEIVATMLALGGLLAATRHRWAVAALLASAAVLTREATLLYLAGYGLTALHRTFSQRRFDRRVLWCLVPPVVYVAWQAALRVIWGGFSYEVIGHDDFSLVPLVDYGRALLHSIDAAAAPPIRYSLLYNLAMSGLVPVFACIVLSIVLRRRTVPAWIVMPWLLYLVITIVFSAAVWRDPWGYVRILNDFYVLGVLVVIVSRDGRWLKRLAPMVGLAWIATVAFAL